MSTLPLETTKSTVWHANYKGLRLEVKHFRYDSTGSAGLDAILRDNWTGYLYLTERVCSRIDDLWLPEELMKYTDTSVERLSYPYMDNCFIRAMPFHGGCTFYSKVCTVAGHREVKLGCDYQHYDDEGCTYTETDVLNDLVAVVDHLEDAGFLATNDQYQTLVLGEPTERESRVRRLRTRTVLGGKN